jgi:hypothetical protein
LNHWINNPPDLIAENSEEQPSRPADIKIAFAATGVF